MGTYQNNVDPKGRVSIPVKFREALGERFYVTRGFDGCIDVYTEEDWEKLVAKVNISAANSKVRRGYNRIVFASASDVELDKQGRILLPANLREGLGITKEVVVLGVGRKIEIWAKAKYDEQQEELLADMAGIAEEIGDFDMEIEF